MPAPTTVPQMMVAPQNTEGERLETAISDIGVPEQKI
jgi:hypothetical protein